MAMEHLIGFNIAPHDNPDTVTYTIAGPSVGLGEYGAWTEAPTNITLLIEPYLGETQFLLEWRVDEQRMTPDQLLNALQGIRQVAETSKIERSYPISRMKIIVTDGFHADKQARSVRLAAIHAFEAALSAATFIEVPRLASNT